MPRLETRWLGVLSSGKSAIFGLPTVEKRAQIPLSDASRLVEGSIESSWIGKEIPRSGGGQSNASHIGERPKLGIIHQAGRGGGVFRK